MRRIVTLSILIFRLIVVSQNFIFFLLCILVDRKKRNIINFIVKMVTYVKYV